MSVAVNYAIVFMNQSFLSRILSKNLVIASNFTVMSISIALLIHCVFGVSVIKEQTKYMCFQGLLWAFLTLIYIFLSNTLDNIILDR